ncbi:MULTISPECIES: GNAT family N-acetyltransferase [unclassified Paenibacillus]|uniref:GNAT family N-acetyltransferase n=1 Tax=unclassified Paenibacillus TaxID=185978 RepID=UPI0009A8F33D|nr:MULTISPECIES: GNAT family N-acetyltransferase [unclassified Paenibacillus]SLK21307.1 Predicted N-acyltransferase, GNAT family [Paenibacillus sp. RU5A]SOC76562.1 Predicted N-acyltransferase, GNAT family [Paenibacillus sp. RU26A]SOC78025.1 Predicted N-acyltransferase, GNAT family [Paenibacillus sp. RU5M]
MNTTIVEANNQELLDACFAIRTAIFVEEQGVPAEDEFDAYDALDTEAKHILLYVDGIPAASSRLRVVENVAKLERICVMIDYRKHGLGRVLIDKLEQMALAQGLKKAKLHAQVQASGFYERLGYTAASDVFMEDGIPHLLMTKKLK